MYTIKAFVDGKEYMIHNPRVKALIVGDPYYQKGDNVNGLFFHLNLLPLCNH